MTLSDLEWRDMSGHNFQADLAYLITLEPFDLERPNLAAEHICGGAHFYGSAAPHRRGVVLKRCPILGFLLFLGTSFDYQI